MVDLTERLSQSSTQDDDRIPGPSGLNRDLPQSTQKRPCPDVDMASPEVPVKRTGLRRNVDIDEIIDEFKTYKQNIGLIFNQNFIFL